MNIAQWVKASREVAEMSQDVLAEHLGKTRGNISAWENGRHEPSFAQILEIAKLTGHKIPIPGLENGKRIVPANENTNIETGEIPYWSAKGSCGGGILNYEDFPAGSLVKEASFFKRYQLKPEHAIAIYADGNSMADFIVDGDIVIFDTSKTEPKSGKIFLIDHPDGLRIKRLRRNVDKSWVLESLNKSGFPDEVIPENQAELLKICGEFVYRQGG